MTYNAIQKHYLLITHKRLGSSQNSDQKINEFVIHWQRAIHFL